MGNISTTLTGSGQIHIDDTGVVVTDVDINVTTIGPHVSAKGPVGHRKLQMAGWLRFQNSTYGATEESVYDPIYFNWEAEDVQISGNPMGLSATDFSYWIPPGTTVEVNVSYPGGGTGGGTVVTGTVTGTGSFTSDYDPPTSDPNGIPVPSGATSVRFQASISSGGDGGEHGSLRHGPDYWNPYDSGSETFPIDETFTVTTTYVRVELATNVNATPVMDYTLTFS